VATQEITNLTVEPYAITAIRHGGRANAQPPTIQRFWVARASSTRVAGINWKVRDGQYRVVIMSANGHRGFATTSTLAITIPNIGRYALAGLLVGLLVVVGGTALLIRATRQPRNGLPSRTTSAPATTTA
jgi:hypothetical protein